MRVLPRGVLGCAELVAKWLPGSSSMYCQKETLPSTVPENCRYARAGGGEGDGSSGGSSQPRRHTRQVGRFGLHPNPAHALGLLDTERQALRALTCAGSQRQQKQNGQPHTLLQAADSKCDTKKTGDSAGKRAAGCASGRKAWET